MLTPSLLTLSLAATSLAAVVVPTGYNKVYLQSLVDTSFVVQAKGVTTGSTVVVYVLLYSYLYRSSGISLAIMWFRLTLSINSNKVNNKADQHWLLTTNTSKIYLANADPPTLCLDAGPKSKWIAVLLSYLFCTCNVYFYIRTMTPSICRGKKTNKNIYMYAKPLLQPHGKIWPPST